MYVHPFHITVRVGGGGACLTVPICPLAHRKAIRRAFGKRSVSSIQSLVTAAHFQTVSKVGRGSAPERLWFETKSRGRWLDGPEAGQGTHFSASQHWGMSTVPGAVGCCTRESAPGAGPRPTHPPTLAPISIWISKALSTAFWEGKTGRSLKLWLQSHGQSPCDHKS